MNGFVSFFTLAAEEYKRAKLKAGVSEMVSGRRRN